VAATDWDGARFLVGDVFDRLATIPDGSVDVIVTSPPFLALRSYLPADHPDKAKEIGSEPTPAAFLDTMLDLTAEWRRVLAPHGSICVELGDSYSGSGGSGGDYNPGGLREGQAKWMGTGRSAQESSAKIPWKGERQGWPQAKSLCGIPTLYAWSIAYGRNLLNPAHECEPWRVRNLIAWTRPNPPVGELGDKVRPGTSYVTTACTGATRYFDNDAERKPAIDQRRRTTNGPKQGDPAEVMTANYQTRVPSNPAGAPLLDHWSIPTQPYTGSHYATFPEELPRRLISLMCPPKVCRTCGKPSERITEPTEAYKEALQVPWRDDGAEGRRAVGRSAYDKPTLVADRVTVGWSDCGHGDWRPGTVLDPFAGSGTTLAVAVGMGRRAIGIDIDERNAHLAEQRVGMFLTVEAA
jgi:site-specific DNA-methyltransferase (cytosine-N4-specific)